MTALIDKNEQSANNPESLKQLVSFRIGSEEFGVDILSVQEIIKLIDITTVPQTPDFIEGVINLRGKVIPVLDLRKRFQQEMKSLDKESRIVVVTVEEMTIGMIVDSVSEVIRIPADTIEPPPDIIASVNAEYIKGVAKLEERLLIFLDLAKVINVEEIGCIEG